MEASHKPTTSLFDVYLRLRPHAGPRAEQFIHVEESQDATHNDPTHITISPPTSENKKRAVERFGFTKVFSENATQRDIFDRTALLSQIEGVLAADAKPGRDGLVATLGVTGSGKSHTILGSKSQRGIIQMTLDTIFRSIGSNITSPAQNLHDITACDVSEAQISSASSFLDGMYRDGESRVNSRAQTPLLVSRRPPPPQPKTPQSQDSVKRQWPILGLHAGHTEGKPKETFDARAADAGSPKTIRPVTGFVRVTRSVANKLINPFQETTANSLCTYPTLPATLGAHSKRPTAPRVSSLPQAPKLDDILVAADREADYAVVISMYEVYNDRIFDLLGAPVTNAPKSLLKDIKRRPLLFKSTEYSPNRKVVAGLRKVVCASLDEALLVLETGIQIRTVTSTSSNAVSSRSHGFVCLEVKKKPRNAMASWSSSTLTIVDLAGSERARNAKTAGATLAEAGKINESLMYLGQCMQMQSNNSANLAEQLNALSNTSSAAVTNPKLVPFRQCKLTELLFSNSFSAGRAGATQQKKIMIVTADACGDYSSTYQILRYSTLAREVTVPRIPSVTASIGLPPRAPSAQDTHPIPSSGSTATASTAPSSRGVPSASSTYSYAYSTATSATIDSQHVEIETLRIELAAARDDVLAKDDVIADMKASFEERLLEQEEELRIEISESYELAMRRARAAEIERREEEELQRERWIDGKIDILTRSTAPFVIHEDAQADADDNAALKVRLEEMEREVARLRGRLAEMEGARTPSRKMKSLKGRKAWGPRESEDELAQENAGAY